MEPPKEATPEEPRKAYQFNTRVDAKGALLIKKMANYYRLSQSELVGKLVRDAYFANQEEIDKDWELTLERQQL